MRRPTAVLAAAALIASTLLAVSGPSSGAPDSGPPREAAGDPARVARDHLAKKQSKYGLTAADVNNLTVSSVVPSKKSGVTHVYLQQRVNGIDIHNALINVAVADDGKVTYVASRAVSSAGKKANDATPSITDVEAAESAAVALDLEPTGSFDSNEEAEGLARERTLRKAGISHDRIPVKLVYQERKDGSLRLAWELVINQLDSEHWWQIRMDANTGKELDKNDWVAYDSYNVYPEPVEAPSFGGRAVRTNPADATGSPFGWHDTNGVAGAEFTITRGNNVNAYTDINDDNAPDAGSQPNGGAGAELRLPARPRPGSPSAYRPAAVTNLFYWNNLIHDVCQYGFNEAAGQLPGQQLRRRRRRQRRRAGRGPGRRRHQQRQLRDPARRLGARGCRCTSGTHHPGPRRRLRQRHHRPRVRPRHLQPPDRRPRQRRAASSDAEQAGEGWSDWFALMLTEADRHEPARRPRIGTYVLGQPATGVGIRPDPYSTDMAINDYDLRHDPDRAAPHGVGYVWATMLWEVTWDLVADARLRPQPEPRHRRQQPTLQLVIEA